MGTDELIPINIVIGDRTYRLKIYRVDEEQIRKLAKQINEQIVQFKLQFAGRDMQDYVAMVLLWFVTQKPTEKKSTADLPDTYLQQLSSLLQKLETAL